MGSISTEQIEQLEKMRPAPKVAPLSHVLETVIYVKSMRMSKEFYSNVLGLKYIVSQPHLTVYPMGDTNLLLFQLGLTNQDLVDQKNPENCIPKHGPTSAILRMLSNDKQKSESQNNLALRQRICLAVASRDDIEDWAKLLASKGVEVESQMDWAERGYSIYFRDPDGNCIEIATAGLWKLFDPSTL